MEKKKGVVAKHQELDHYKKAYGKSLKFRDYIKNVLFPFAYGGGITLLMLHNFWIALLIGGIYGIYGYRILLPKNVFRFYNHEAYIQRNRLLNNLTQILVDPNISWYHALEIVVEQIQGELKDDLYQLIASLYSASENERIQLFQKFQEKHEEDKVFGMYVDQLSIISIEGRTTIDMFRDINSFHNQLKAKQLDFIRLKLKVLRQIEFAIGLIVGILMLLHYYPLGLKGYEEAFANQFFGVIVCSLFLVLSSLILHKACISYFDDKIME